MFRSIVILVFCVFTSTAARANSYGAIAYSPQTLNAGASFNWLNKQSAVNAALIECNAYDCREVAWVVNACSALAVSESDPYWYATAWDVHLELAKGVALQSCGPDCYIRSWVCSF